MFLVFALSLAQLGFAVSPAWAGSGLMSVDPLVPWVALCLVSLALGVVLVQRMPWGGRRQRLKEQSSFQKTVKTLRKLEEQYNSFRDNAPVGIFHTKPEGNFLYANAKMAKILGYGSPEEVLEQVKDISSQLYLDPSERTSLFRKLLIDGMVKNVEVHFRRRDGEVIWISLSARAVPDLEGGIDHVEGFAVNMTERRLAEEAHAASERMLRQMLLWMRDVVFRLDHQGHIVFINPAVARYGFKQEELYGKPILDLVHPDDRERCRRNVTERRTGDRRTSGVEFRLACKEDCEGEYFPPLMSLEAEGLYEANASAGLIFVGTIGRARDITRNKLAEMELNRTIETKDILLRELQHRVKNNIQVISSLISLSRDKSTEPEAVNICREIQGYVNCMASMHSLLSKATTGDMLNLGDMVREIFVSAANLFGQRNVIPHFDLDNVPLHMDKALPCGMILNELFTNIFKHAFPDDRTGQVWVQLNRLPQGKVKLVVSDDGVGFGNHEQKCGYSIGMGLIHLLADQLNAELSLTETPGAEAKMIFKTTLSRHQLKGRVVPKELELEKDSEPRVSS